MALRVPGARNVTEFWKNLCDGVESIRTFSTDDLLAEGEDPERIHHPNYVPRGADLPDMEMFDAEFFSLNPKEAAIMDPQHRHFLECAWEAMEDAGRISSPHARRGPVGIFAGCGMGAYFYFNVCSNRNLVDQVGMFLLRHTGNDKDFLATRASFTFDLQGPSVNIQTACSTSLVAVHYACQSLISGECDMALAGGVTIEFPHRRGYMFQEGEILSPDGHCRAFDHRAAGTVFGSGVGVVVLRRLSDALRDGDAIHAVIKGTAVNNDGSSKAGYLAPSVSGQAAAILEAQGLAGVEAETIQYVECHGTGTFLGDPIEIEALTEAFRQSTDRTGFCHVGSVKSNIGHLDTAAGVVGLIKAALAVSEGTIPPTVGFERPNPAIDFERSPFRVNNTLIKWPDAPGPRRAAVNSLGVGGTNAHAIIEQAPSPYTLEAEGEGSETEGDSEPTLLFLSARQRRTIDQMADRLAAVISGQPRLSLSDISYTLQHGRKHFDHRMVLAVRGREDAIDALSNSASRGFVHQPVPNPSGAVFLFPGGGAQHVGMAKRLYEEEDAFRATVDEGLSYLSSDAAAEIRATWLTEYNAAAAKAFLRPSLQLPAILITEIGLARLWIDWGIKPKALIGHSMGENAAACLAGVISFRDAVNLVHLRGRLFETIRPSGMLSVPLSRDAVSELLPASLDVASVNAPSLCVVSGLNEDLEDFQRSLSEQGVDATRIPIDIAAHSRLVDPILDAFETFLRSISLRAPAVPILSNRTGLPLNAEEATDPMYWVGHLRSTVHFSDGIAALAADPGLVYIEIGPGRVLSSLTKAQGSIPANRVINSLPHPDEAGDDRLHFLSAIGRAWAVGLDVNIDRLWEGCVPRRVRLPTYPFQHRRFFIERSANDRRSGSDPVLAKEADIERWGYRPTWKQTLVDYEPGREKEPRSWLFFMDSAGIASSLVDRLRASGHRVVTISLGDAFIRRSATDYTLCPEFGRAGYDALIAGLSSDGKLPSHVVHMWLLTQEEIFRPGSNFFHRNQECGFDSILYLAQAWADAGGPQDIHFTIVTNGMQQVAEEPLPYPEKATVLGPALVLPKEIAGATIKVVDIDLPVAARALRNGSLLARLTGRATEQENPDAAALIEQLWEDIHAKPACEVVSLRKGRRWTQVHQRLPLKDVPGKEAKLRERDVYFFSGGLSEIALALAGELVRRFQARIVLVGRTILPRREHWDLYDRTHRHDSVRRAISAIRKLEESGADVLYLNADVANPEQMARAVETSLSRFGEINGVFHAAGFVDDGLIQTKTREGMDRVLTPKVLGTSVLDAAFESVPLDFVVMFSSTSTDVVRAGQVDYVAANAYLNAFAQSRSHRTDRATIALHWGVWSEIGLAARALGYPKAQDGVRPVSGPAAGPFFQRWMEDETGTPWLEGLASPETQWMLSEHRLVSGQAVMPGTGYMEVLAQAVREYGLSFEAEVTDLVFLKPLVFGDGETRALRLRLEPLEGQYRVVILAGPPDGQVESFAKHVEAILKPLKARPAQLIDIASLGSSCRQKRVAEGDATLSSVQERHIRFGPRWAVLRSIAMGEDMAVADLRLDSSFAGDLAKGVLLHPALLDIATGFALELARDYEPETSLWAPAAYGRIVLYKPLPPEIVSIVHIADSGDLGEGYAAFDVTIADRRGDVVFEAERFVMRRLESDVALASLAVSDPHATAPRKHASPSPSPSLARLAAQLRNGILPAEGFEALLRAIATSEPQPIISSIDLELLRNWVAATAEVAAPAGDNFERPDLENEFIAPRNAIEETLAGYWRELLGIAKVGVHDSFFDIGGHSLIAVRLFRMIKKQYGLDLPISMLFEAPTIAQCAEKIAAELPAAEGSDGPGVATTGSVAAKPLHLVLMNPGKDTKATPLFICAGMFGNILNLRHLAMSMGADRPVYGLQARGLFGDREPHLSFEDMAADYIAEMRMVQPHGPYLLGGYSGGGITAYEIARQLKETGEEVSHVVMLDTPLPRQPQLAFRDRLLIKLQDIRRHKASYFAKYFRDRKRHEASNRARQEAGHESGTTDQFNNEKIEFAFRHAAREYQVKPYAGPVTLFRPKPAAFYRLSGGRSLKENRDILLADNGWREHVAQLNISEVPGDHDSMVLDPYVRVLAERMRMVVAEASGEQKHSEPSGATELLLRESLASRASFEVA
ncbi:type I polyketide synthase [Rhizobium terrae]|uniref:type I polyketide synthase n=1 Tax=Rhizobium terrae TaxID=2171756 RepID=UPI0021F8F54D|nr:type I polyketide synthase [Rhizobium terrae]